MDVPTALHTHLIEIRFDAVSFGEDLLRWSLEPWWHEEEGGTLEEHAAAELADLEGNCKYAQFSFDGHYVRALDVQLKGNVDDNHLSLAQMPDPATAPIGSTLASGRWLLGVAGRVVRPATPADFDMRRGVVRDVRVQVFALTPLPVLTEERVKALVDGARVLFRRDPDYGRPEDTRMARETRVAAVTVSEQTYEPGDLVEFENGARVTVLDAHDGAIPGRRSLPGVVWFCEDVPSETLGMEPALDDITVGHMRDAGGRKVGRVNEAVLQAILADRERQRRQP